MEHVTFSLPSPLIRVTPQWKNIGDINLFVKRDDLIHPIVSGNKYRKLGALLDSLKVNPRPVLSFGGGFSNHLHALAYCCQQLGCPFTAVVRGHYPTLTPMLKDIQQWGATLHFVDKVVYRQRHESAYLAQWYSKIERVEIVPEGGSQHSALNGLNAMMKEVTQPFDIFAAPVASGATLAGVVANLAPNQKALGIGVLKGEDYLSGLVAQFVDTTNQGQWHVDGRFHCGGYAKITPDLDAFCHQFNDQTGIAIEPVYSGKLFFALKHMTEAGEFPRGSTIVALHTGGLQGARPIKGGTSA